MIIFGQDNFEDLDSYNDNECNSIYSFLIQQSEITLTRLFDKPSACLAVFR